MRRTIGLAVLIASLYAFAGPPSRVFATDEPQYIVVCESGGTGGCSNPSNIYVQVFETQYVGNVLPNEWNCSWNSTSLKAGSIAVRTYGWYRVNHPRSSSYDIYGNSNDQNFVNGSHNSTCDARIDDTAGMRVTYSGSPIFAAYRHDCGDPTEDGGKPYLVPVSDPYSLLGPTGPGVSQIGTKGYGGDGYSYTYILNHYYTGVTVATGAYYFISQSYECVSGSRHRVELWHNTVTDTDFTRTYDAGPCIE